MQGQEPEEVEGYALTEDPLFVAISKRFEHAFSNCPAEANGRQHCKTVRKGDSVHIEIVSTFKLKVKDGG